LRFLPAVLRALLAAGTCGAETVVLAEGEGSALAASNWCHPASSGPGSLAGAAMTARAVSVAHCAVCRMSKLLCTL